MRINNPHGAQHINCKICGSDNAKFMGIRGNMEFVGARSLPNEQHRITNVVKCRRCGFVYTNPFLILTDEEKKEAYNDPLEYESFSSSDFENLYRYTFRLINKYKRSGRLLDIGAGKGEFLNFARRKGWETYGIEPSKDFVAYSKQSYGLDIQCGDLNNVAFADNFFDVVTLNMVLEHLENPIGVLENVKRLLKDDGVIFVEVPNTDSLMLKFAKIYFFIQGKNWSPLLSPLHWPFHSFGYTMKTLKYICNNKGWEMLESDITSIKYRGFRKDAIKRAGVLNSFFRNIASKTGNLLRMGDVICVLLTKSGKIIPL